mmetsp:Transcript_2389/g.5979  ORF Transcript_2389/g.5979 Transcript_2389/m.5979 type:complete len:241 (+) Transcript_2389:835-1557(+)
MAHAHSLLEVVLRIDLPQRSMVDASADQGSGASCVDELDRSANAQSPCHLHAGRNAVNGRGKRPQVGPMRERRLIVINVATPRIPFQAKVGNGEGDVAVALKSVLVMALRVKCLIATLEQQAGSGRHQGRKVIFNAKKLVVEARHHLRFQETSVLGTGLPLLSELCGIRGVVQVEVPSRPRVLREGVRLRRPNSPSLGDIHGLTRKSESSGHDVHVLGLHLLGRVEAVVVGGRDVELLPL